MENTLTTDLKGNKVLFWGMGRLTNVGKVIDNFHGSKREEES